MNEPRGTPALLELFRAMQSDDAATAESAVTSLYELYSERIWRWAYAVLRTTSQIREPERDAEDMAHEVLVRFPEKARSFRESSEPEAVAWLQQITVNAAITYLRQRLGRGKNKRSFEISLEDADRMVDHIRRAELADQVAAVTERLEALRNSGTSRNARMAEIGRLKLEGYDLKEIAEHLGLKYGSVRNLAADLYAYLGRDT